MASESSGNLARWYAKVPSSSMTLDKLTGLVIAVATWLAAGVSVVYHLYVKYSERTSEDYADFVETAPGQWRRAEPYNSPEDGTEG